MITLCAIFLIALVIAIIVCICAVAWKVLIVLAALLALDILTFKLLTHKKDEG